MPVPGKRTKAVFQCDFDGTITVEDISFLILDNFAEGDWRAVLEEYKSSLITVGEFNSKAFELVKQDRLSLEQFVISSYRIRPGFNELIECCREHDIRFVIVSNGLDFYIKAIMKDLGLENVEIYSAKVRFEGKRIHTFYSGPEGFNLVDGFKDSYVEYFTRQGFKIIYAGNGLSDAAPARLASHRFAIDSLAARLTESATPFFPFTDLKDISLKLKNLEY